MRAPDNDNAPWQATAAYLYLLRLDAASLAWEYLRRSPAYRACWRQYGHAQGRRAPPGAAQPWGLVQLEDPQLDARRAHPVWDDRMPALLHVYAIDGPAGGTTDAGLNLWHIPGEKRLAALPAGGYALQVRDDDGAGHSLRARLGAGVLDGRPALCAVPLDARLRAQTALLAEHAAHFVPRRAAASGQAHPVHRHGHPHVHPVTQASLHHLHALQALDGAQAGASQRHIAEALYGTERVQAQWHADSALRAQVRHSLARGYALMRGGYRQLAGLPPADADRSTNTQAAA
ncbi:MAG: hypothetical protein ABS43_31555 [Bordetella sp. SCN 67-23]|jgi:hypothetical protein|nr:DUF2285 domain-containing protein [Burkholderiales bacterium]ODS65550.1 MAG: hypothetical protein ABS43_31555 [Bordetella sp. SCN 67-23]ODV09409.1 MAG: hypothetical protein ABT20_10955 [Rubrivivax sp. SCN 70-15]OJW94060.1 MAG: hypothetical protein BGO71_24990 [Burkholderiales bacterium 67-32]